MYKYNATTYLDDSRDDPWFGFCSLHSVGLARGRDAIREDCDSLKVVDDRITKLRGKKATYDTAVHDVDERTDVLLEYLFLSRRLVITRSKPDISPQSAAQRKSTRNDSREIEDLREITGIGNADTGWSTGRVSYLNAFVVEFVFQTGT